MRTARQTISVGLSALMLASTLEGCTAWHSRPLEPAMFTAEKPPSEVRVTLVGGRRITLGSPALSGDSLIGVEYNAYQPSNPPARVALPLAEVSEVAVRQGAPGRTTLLVLGIGVGVLLVAASAAYSGSSGSSNYPGGYGSCPFVYSWDGKDWRLDSGTFGGAIMRTLARTDVDNLDFAMAANGRLRLKLANELDETDSVDALDVLAVDHDPGVSVAPDGEGRLHTLGAPAAPARASDFRGRDALARVRAVDGWSWESNPTGRDPALAADVRDGLELAFPRPRDARAARLVIDGNNTLWAVHMLEEYLQAHGRTLPSWYDSLEANPARARAVVAGLAREAFLTASVRTTDGWVAQGMFWEAGPEIAKRQVMALDLSRCEGDTVRIRLESVPCFWQLDRVALDVAAERPVAVNVLKLDRAVGHDGKDLRPLLTAIDGNVLRMEPGESAELTFRAAAVPQGKSRSYLVRSHGWYRIHTAETGDPDTALLESVAGQPLGVSSAAVARANHMLRRLEEAAR
jgi:hypothetical protein